MIDEKYKIVIVDDERAAINGLIGKLEPYEDLEIVGTASTGTKGKKIIMELRPDLLFLDVELPDIQGIQLLSEIRDQVSWDMKVVFYTAYDKYLLQALRESAFDYLLKPFEKDELVLILDRFRKAMYIPQSLPSFTSSVNSLLPGKDMFLISTVTGFKLLHVEEIGYFEYLKDKRQWLVTLFDQSKLGLRKNTTADDVTGYSSSFVQISQSAVINVNYLAMIKSKQCLLYPPFNDKEDLYISRGFLKELQERLNVI